ncbi:type I restriction enzyme HsdR N-terminal domain-containing protein [Mesorhizobium sp. B2-4-13]|uniref:type I restriction enzyme HsdR N-terminal domain-containing protein n=1 Tax=Mesorhizobium sp. B2-4-13 TaxID=2589936 RepID=UPI00115468F7|nr:type I restriction enzyme HsdR N-terminal domain-containing protein [Mesorhizobium sp. B2-4-13]TPK85686.1 type I restriction enzyme HsdR N-terminal domain-containing protein [Mesorhizobium sp. B2-4-13]
MKLRGCTVFMQESFWNTIAELATTSEANVEAWFVEPLLLALGHERRCISSKEPVEFQLGSKRRGRKAAADFVVYAAEPFGRATSLIVVETKRTNVSLEKGREQGESYAQNLGAPILLLTNGVQLEVWQMQISSESQLVFKGDVAGLAAHRGELEAILGKEAIKSHSTSLPYKRFDVLARDLGVYEVDEHERISALVCSAIPRTLRDVSAEQEVKSAELTEARPGGAVLVGMSGYGKTTLAGLILVQGFERRWQNLESFLPIDVFLPDLALSSGEIETFLTNRIAAHKPGFTGAMFSGLAQKQGLLIAADGFDRVPHEKRGHVESMLRLLLKDYPKTRLYLTSRVQTAPKGLDLPVLHLQEYSDSELSGLEDRRSALRPEMRGAFSQAPNYVLRLARVPMFADRLLEHFARKRTHITDLALLYEEWFRGILQASGALDQALDRKLLEEIAIQTAAGPISVKKAIELGQQQGDSRAALNRLEQADAISVRGATLELPHEGLADYLRAKRHWETNVGERKDSLERLNFDPSSQFATLLVATAPTPKDRSGAWQAVAKADLELAVRTLHFGVGDERPNAADPQIDVHRLLDDIRQSIETLVAAHFPQLRSRILGEIAGVPVQELGIMGAASSDDVQYSFFDARGRSNVELLPGHEKIPLGKFYGQGLRRSGFGAEAGRLLGAKRVEDALDGLLKARRLRGGSVWTEELVFGRLRHLASLEGFSVREVSVQQAYNALKPVAHEFVELGSLTHGQRFPISELLEDLAWLLEQGKTEIVTWWDDLESVDVGSTEGQERLAGMVNEYNRRVQVAYAEMADRSFPALKPHLQALRTMPLRLQIEVKGGRGGVPEELTLYYRRWPVRTYDEAGADVTFPVALSDYPVTREATQAYVEETSRLLRLFDRWHPEPAVTWGSTGVPDFPGHDTMFGGLPDESAVVRGAVKLLTNDLKRLFAELP